MSPTSHFNIRVPIAIKLALAITLLIVSGMSALGFIILENQKSILSKQINNMGSAITQQFANSSSEMVLSDDNLGLQTLANSLVENQQIIGAVIISDQYESLVSNGLFPSLEFIKHQMGTSNTAHTFNWKSSADTHNNYICFSTPIKFNQLIAGHVLVTFSQEQMLQALESSRFIIILVTVLMIAIAIVLAFVMSCHLSKPIHNLVNASKAIGEGDFRYRLNERRNDEIGELARAFNKMAQGLLKKSQVEDAFSRYVSSSVAEKILQNLDVIELGGKHVNASVLFADIVGFTSISEKLPPEEITDILNEYFTYISKIAEFYHGHIDKFMGDCAMLVFGVPNKMDDHRFNAIACAVMIRETIKRLNIERLKAKKIPIHFRIGVNSGNMIAGNLGSSERMEYTVIGDPVNIASRLASIAGSDEIIILEEFYNQDDISSAIHAVKHKTIHVRGKQDMVSTWLVHSTNNIHNKLIKQQVDEMISAYKTEKTKNEQANT